MMKACCFALLSLVACACSITPALVERQDPAAVIGEIFARRISLANASEPDRQVVEVDDDGIRYRERDQDRALRFQDIAIVEREVPRDAEREIEIIRLYLKRGTPSIKTAAPVSPVLDFRQAHVFLDRRPLGSLDRLKGALQQLSERRALRQNPASKESNKPEPKLVSEPKPVSEPEPKPEPKADAPKSDLETVDLEAIEERLKVLKRWRAQDLISEDDYLAKKRALLERM